MWLCSSVHGGQHKNYKVGYNEMWRKASELLLFPLYLYKIILPEVKPKGFDPADLRKIAMDSRAIQTNEYSKFVRSPLWI